MKKVVKFVLQSVALALCVAFMSSCSETEEVSRYDNWQERNESFIDSLANVYDSKLDPELMAVTNEYDKNSPKIYFKKEIKQTEGITPQFNDSIEVFYLGVTILGDKFDGNFDGKEVQINDKPEGFALNKVIPGWNWALQHVREGERVKLYIPWQSGYGSKGSTMVPGYSTLIFTVQVEKVIKKDKYK